MFVFKHWIIPRQNDRKQFPENKNHVKLLSIVWFQMAIELAMTIKKGGGGGGGERANGGSMIFI